MDPGVPVGWSRNAQCQVSARETNFSSFEVQPCMVDACGYAPPSQMLGDLLNWG